MKADLRKVHYAISSIRAGKRVPCKPGTTIQGLVTTRLWARVTCVRCRARRPK